MALTGREALPWRAATSPHLIIFHLAYGCAAPPVAAASVPGPVSLGRERERGRAAQGQVRKERTVAEEHCPKSEKAFSVKIIQSGRVYPAKDKKGRQRALLSIRSYVLVGR